MFTSRTSPTQPLLRTAWQAAQRPARRLPRPAGVVALASIVLGLLPSEAAHAAKPAEDPTLAVFEIYYRGKVTPKTAEYASKVEQRIVKEGGFDVINRMDAEKLVFAKYPKSDAGKIEEVADEIGKMVEEANRIFFEQGAAPALEKLREARDRLQLVVDSMSLTEELKKGYIDTQMLLALVYLKSNAADKADEVMRALVRQVGQDATINTDNYHPDAVALYKDVYRKLSESRVGQITVRSAPPGADVYINGIKQDRTTPAVFEGLFPGEVRVQIKKGDQASHVRKVMVDTGKALEFDIDLDFESALAFTGARYGLEFKDELDRKRNIGRYAARLGELVGVDYVALVGLGEDKGESMIEGYLVQVEADKLVRGTGMDANANVVSKRRIGEMAFYLMYGITEFKTAYLPWYENTTGWIFTGVGVAAGGLGGLFYSMYSSDREIAECDPGNDLAASGCKPQSTREDAKTSAETNRTLAYASFGVGAASLVTGILVFALDDREDPEAEIRPSLPEGGVKTTGIAPFVTPDGTAGVSAAFSF